MRPIPSPKSLPVFGTMLSLMAAGGAPKLHLYVDKRHKELGSIYREKIGPVSGVFISDGNYMRNIFRAEGKFPKHIVPEAWLLYNEIYGCKRGLLFMNDDEWLKFRKIMNNIMLKVKKDEFYNGTNLVSENLIEDWRANGIGDNLEQRLYKWSLEVIVALILGADNYKSNKQNLIRSIEDLAKVIHEIFVESAKLSLIPVKLAIKLKFPVWKRFVLAANTTVKEGSNLVDKMLQIENSNPTTGSLISEILKTDMKLEDIRRIVTDLILAAGDTTTHTMQWLLHLLSIDQPVQELIYKQLIDFDEKDITQCPLLKGSLKEALRLYPVAPFITRFMPEDLEMDGYLIKAKELVLMSLYSSGRNEEYFPNPERFEPGRWIRNGKMYDGVTNPNASLPFAMGSRSCIGKKIAETQIMVTISKILRNFIIKSERKSKIQIKLHLISVPSEPLSIYLAPRKTK